MRVIRVPVIMFKTTRRPSDRRNFEQKNANLILVVSNCIDGTLFYDEQSKSIASVANDTTLAI